MPGNAQGTEEQRQTVNSRHSARGKGVSGDRDGDKMTLGSGEGRQEHRHGGEGGHAVLTWVARVWGGASGTPPLGDQSEPSHTGNMRKETC